MSKAQGSNPVNLINIWILEFGHWNLDIGIWILDLGIWTLDIIHFVF
jgi:hypothetical protein